MNNPVCEQKVALVTGAARRVGAVITERLHEIGMNLIVHYHGSSREAQALNDKLNLQRANSALAIKADLSDTTQITSLVTAASAKWGRLDVVVNNASSYFPTVLGNVTENQFDDLIASNFKGPFFLVQAALHELQQSQGSVINIVDINAARPAPNYSVYCAAKAALVALTKAFAIELAPNVRVNAVAPGAILWPEGVNQFSETKQKQILQQVPLRRVGSPEDIADTVLFLVQQNYITGQVIAVDGGRSINYTN
jgi:pteridine reductase